MQLRRAAIDALDRITDIYGTKSYSQEGEDMILRRLFEGKSNGFYVDVGAHHPRRFSNTFYFYRRGWRGINIEPNPDAMAAFRSARSRDTNLQLGIGETEGVLTYYCFEEPALNTFDSSVAHKRQTEHDRPLAKTQEIPVRRLSAVLEAHVPTEQTIDFLSIDVEGFDLSVLRSNDWKRFRPHCVLVESLDKTLEEIVTGDVCVFMKERGYVVFAKTFNTLFFRTTQQAMR